MKAGCQNKFQSFLRSGAVVIFFSFREFIVRNKAWMMLCGVVADRAIGPAIVKAVFRPHFMDVSCHFLYERKQLFGKVNAGGIDHMGCILRCHLYEFYQSNESISMNDDHVSSAG